MGLKAEEEQDPLILERLREMSETRKVAVMPDENLQEILTLIGGS